jgi:hypothetical protein
MCLNQCQICQRLSVDAPKCLCWEIITIVRHTCDHCEESLQEDSEELVAKEMFNTPIDNVYLTSEVNIGSCEE